MCGPPVVLAGRRVYRVRAELSPWPDWNQRTDPGDGGEVSQNAMNDCGPESVAEVVWHLTGVELEADYIKDVIKGEGYVGYTSVADLSGYLNTRAGVPTRAYAGDATTKLQPVVQAALSAGCPIIVLFFWDLNPASPTYLTGGHFCPVVACDDQVVTRSNPWTGQRESWSWAHFEEFQQMGTALVCLRRRGVVPVMPALPH